MLQTQMKNNCVCVLCVKSEPGPHNCAAMPRYCGDDNDIHTEGILYVTSVSELVI